MLNYDFVLLGLLLVIDPASDQTLNFFLAVTRISHAGIRIQRNRRRYRKCTFVYFCHCCLDLQPLCFTFTNFPAHTKKICKKTCPSLWPMHANAACNKPTLQQTRCLMRNKYSGKLKVPLQSTSTATTNFSTTWCRFRIFAGSPKEIFSGPKQIQYPIPSMGRLYIYQRTFTIKINQCIGKCTILHGCYGVCINTVKTKRFCLWTHLVAQKAEDALCQSFNPVLQRFNDIELNQKTNATPLKFNSSPLKSYRNPIGKACLPTTIFQGGMLNFRGVKVQCFNGSNFWILTKILGALLLQHLC